MEGSDKEHLNQVNKVNSSCNGQIDIGCLICAKGYKIAAAILLARKTSKWQSKSNHEICKFYSNVKPNIPLIFCNV